MRLTIQNVAAPDLSGTSRILENANKSFNQGLDNAASLLDKYSQGQQENVDNAILSQLPGIKSEKDFDAFVNSGAIQGTNLSPKVHETLLNLRKNLLNNEQARASTDGTRASTNQTLASTDLTRANIDQSLANTNRINSSTAIAEASEGRTSTLFDQSQDRHQELIGLSGQLVNARTEGNNIGFGSTTGRQLAELTASNETGTSNLVDASKQVANDTGGSKSYGFLGVNSGSGSASDFAKSNPNLGLTAEPGTIEFDRQWAAANLRDPQAVVDAQLKFQDEKILAPARRNLQKYGLGRFADDPRVLSFVGDTVVQYGASGSEKSIQAGSNARTVEEFIQAASANQISEVDSRFKKYLSENPNNRDGLINRLNQRRDQALSLSGSANTQLNESLANTSNLLPNEIIGLQNQANEARGAGQARINAEEAAVSRERGAAAILDGALAPDVTNQTGLTRRILSDESLGNVLGRLDIASTIPGIVDRAALGDILSPPVQDDSVNLSVTAANELSNRSISNTTQTRVIDEAVQYDGNPGKALIDALDIRNDGVFSNVSESDFNRNIDRIADKYNIPPSLAASALAQFANKDILPGNDFNDHFDEKAAEQWILDNLNPESRTNLSTSRNINSQNTDGLNRLNSAYNNLRVRAQKEIELNGQVSPQLTSQIQQVLNQIQSQINPSTSGQ